MNGRIRIQRPVAFESRPGMLSEIDHALALICTAHWIGISKPRPKRNRELPHMIDQIVGPVYVCFGLGLALFYVCQGFGRGFAAVIANGVRLLVNSGAVLAAIYWLGFGVTG